MEGVTRIDDILCVCVCNLCIYTHLCRDSHFPCGFVMCEALPLQHARHFAFHLVQLFENLKHRAVSSHNFS